MKIAHDVLSNKLLKEIDEEFVQSDNQWSAGLLTWQAELNEGIVGTCLVKPLSLSLSEQVEYHIKEHVPPFISGSLSYMCHCWLPNSGIGVHNDPHVKWAATIYLNKDWPLNGGGWFLWNESKKRRSSKFSSKNLNFNPKDKPFVYEENIWKAMSPTRNVMIINDKREDHLVTPISPYMKNNYRYSIQIWCHYDDNNKLMQHKFPNFYQVNKNECTKLDSPLPKGEETKT